MIKSCDCKDWNDIPIHIIPLLNYCPGCGKELRRIIPFSWKDHVSIVKSGGEILNVGITFEELFELFDERIRNTMIFHDE